MRRFWEQLTESQKRIMIAGVLFAVVAAFVQFALLPYLEAREKVRGAITASEKSLREIAVLGAEYGALKQRSEEIRQVIQRRPPGFALFSYLERRASDAGVKANIKSINPLKSVPGEGHEESSVEMRLERLTMKQLTDFLYHVESREELVRVRKMSIMKMKENPDFLSLVLQVHTFQALPPGGGR